MARFDIVSYRLVAFPERPMKRVLLTTYPSAFLHQGGGEREIHLLADALNSEGLFAEIYGPFSRPIHEYSDIIHFSMMGGSSYLLDDVLNAGGHRLILWPNLWFVDPPSAGHLQQLRSYLAMFQAIVFRSQAEEDHFRIFFDLAGKDVIRVGHLVSPKFLRRGISNVFSESHGLHRYAIWPGIIEPQKNQLTAIRACAGLDLELVISGRVRDKAYLARCQREAGPNVRFIPPLPFGSELHLSALCGSSLFVELPLDFPGVSAMEAAAAGCRLLLSRSAWTDEVMGAFCTQVNPKDVDAVRIAIQAAWGESQSVAFNYSVLSMGQAIDALCLYLKSA